MVGFLEGGRLCAEDNASGCRFELEGEPFATRRAMSATNGVDADDAVRQ
jgi:hypothetical protein